MSLKKSEIHLEQKIEELELKYLNKEDYMCSIEKKECDYIDNDGYKLLYDYGHYTKNGAKYFGKKIFKMNWLKLN